MAKNYQVGLIIKGNAKGGVTAIKATKDELGKLNKSQKSFQKDAKASSSSIAGITSKLGLLTGVLAGVSIGALAKQIYTGIDAMQGMEAQLLTITGSASAAGLELDRLVGFAKKTPFTIQQSVDAFSRLINMGLNPSEEAMMSYGNTAAAMGKDMMQMVEAVADAAVGEFERLKEFGIKAKNNGDSIAFTFQGNTKSIKNDSASIESYLQSIGNNEFAGSMTNQMTRLSAKTSNLGISFMELSATLGDAGLSAIFGYAIDSAATLVDWFNHLIASGEAMDSLTIWAEQFGEAWSLLKEDFNITNEVDGMGAAFGEIGKYSQEFIDQFAARFDYLFEVIRDLPAHLRTIVGIVFGEIQILWEKIKEGTMFFFSFLDEGWKNMGHAASKAWGFIELSFAKLSDSIIQMMGGAIKTVADGLSLIPGMDDQAASVYAAAAALNGMAVAGARVQSAQEAANQAHERQLEIISLTRAAAKADSEERINDINTRIMTIIKERDALIEKANKARAAAAEDRKSEKEAKKAASEKIQQDREIATLAAKTKKPITTKEEDDFYKKAIDGVNGYSEAWSKAGNVIIDTFGSIGQQMEKLFTSQEVYTKAIEINHKNQKKAGADIGKLKKEELAFTRASMQAEINSYGSIAGAAASMFDEKSKAAKAFHTIEQTMAIASLAMSVQKMAMGTTETGVHIANEGTKQGANALTAITSAFAAPFPVNFVAGAAMIGIMASLIGGSFGGSSSSFSLEDKQDNQNTGTVFGDSSAKSNSVDNSFERLEELELDQYAELQQMNASLRSLNQNITRLAVSLVGSYGKFDEQSYGGELGSKSSTSKFQELMLGGVVGQVAKALDPTGIVSSIFSSFSKTKKTLIDSGITIISQTMGEIIESGMVNAQAYYDVETKKTSWWGAKKKYSTDTEYQDLGDSFNRSFGLVFSNITDTINQSVDLLGLDVAKETQNFGNVFRDIVNGKNKFEPDEFDAYFENLNTGIADGAARSLENFKINLPKVSFKDMTGEEIEQELQAMVSNQADLMAQYLVPQIAEFQQVGEGLYDTLIRVSQEQVLFNNALEAMGHSISGIAGMTKQVETEIAQSIISLVGGLDNFREYTSTYFSEFLTDGEQFDYLKNNLSEVFDGLGQSLPATRDEFKALMSGIDRTTESGQALYASLLSMSGSLDQYYDTLESNNAKIANLTSELNQLDMSPLSIQLTNLQKEIDEAAELGADVSLLEKLYGQRRKAIIETALGEINNAYDQAVNSLTSSNQQLMNSFSSLNASISSSILDIRRQGSGWNEGGYQSGQISSFSDMLGQGSVQDQLTNIGNLKGAYVAKYNAELDSLNSAKNAAQSSHDSRVSQLNQQYQLELSIYESIKNSLDSLKKAADDLLLSDYSTLTNQERFTEAKSQFDSILALAKTGDENAIGNLSSVGNNYLAEAQGFYASGSEYSSIFDQVFGAFNEIGSQSLLTPSQPIAPPVPASISRHNNAIRELQESTVEKLLELKDLTAELEAENKSEFDLAMLALNDQLSTDTALIEAELNAHTLELQTQTELLQQVAVNDHSVDIVNQLISVEQQLATQTSILQQNLNTANSQVRAAQAQTQEAREQSEQLRAALREQKFAYERNTDELQNNIRQA